MSFILILAILIIIVVILLSVLTVNRGYSYKHTIDPAPKSDEKVDSESDTPSHH